MAKSSDILKEDVPLDMTPMIDCVFLLIIFFLCIDFKILEAKLPAYLPKDVGTQHSKVEPQEKVQIELHCKNWGTQLPRHKHEAKSSFYLEGHDVFWRVGPKTIDNLDDLKRDLTKICADKSKWQRDPKDSVLKPMAVVIEPRKNITYGDVAMTVDAVNASGFKEINFGGGMGARDKK